MALTAIIAGTGFNKIDDIKLEEQIINTPYGSVRIHMFSDRNIVFINRHNMEHNIPPHKVNYKANMMALSMLGVKKILAAFAVGSINLDLKPGSLALLSDFLDFTKGRDNSFFNGDDSGVVHVDMSSPFCPVLSKSLLDSAPEFGFKLYPDNTYVCTEGPRLETPAEIRMFRMLGGDVVGMTCVPEVFLAKELDIQYAAVGLSINWAAGIDKSSINFITDSLDDVKRKVIKLFIKTLQTQTVLDLDYNLQKIG
ncbi:MAG: MTAP family purine nucleoside phosphorylase [Clostridia bacterium]|nr:MTAP family purine nucleoside phosphorylase [Clostridia bacterium]